MSEDRPVEDYAAAIAALRAELEDHRSTVLARLPTMPTGTMLETLATTPPPGTLLLQGQTVSRTTYARLWQWVQDTSAGGFGVGDGSTTFTLPDTRGKVLRGAATGETVGQAVGSDSRTLTTANLPVHGHTGTAASTGAHIHDSGNGQMASTGDHGGHFPGSQFNAAAGGDLGLAAWNSGGGNRGGHNHFFTFDILSAGAHAHTLTINNTGDGQAVDLRQASIAVNHLIWT